MRTLRLVGLSEDGQRVVFADDGGAEFAAPADDRLRAALRGDRARLGQLEIDMESALRPRDIQARIRAGESPEAVAAIAGVSVEKIMPYCVPVLAERQHIAELAGRCHVRRKNADGPARRLFEVVAEKLRSRGVDPTATEWDAWRRDDGRWSIQGSYQSGERQRAALFSFDSVGRFSLADNDEAKWLTGERQATSKGPQPRDTAKPSERRLASVPAVEDLLTLSEAVDDEATDDDLTAVIRAVREAEVEPPAQPVDTTPEVTADEAGVDAADQVTVDVEEPSEQAVPQAVNASPAPPASTEPVTEPTPDRRRKAARRASVPSWDEIMLGKRKDQ